MSTFYLGHATRVHLHIDRRLLAHFLNRLHVWELTALARVCLWQSLDYFNMGLWSFIFKYLIITITDEEVAWSVKLTARVLVSPEISHTRLTIIRE